MFHSLDSLLYTCMAIHKYVTTAIPCVYLHGCDNFHSDYYKSMYMHIQMVCMRMRALIRDAFI